MTELSTNLISNPVAKEANVPETQPHIPVETKVHAPTHPTNVLECFIHPESQSRERNLAWTGKVIKIAGSGFGTVASCPLYVRRLVWTGRKATESTIMVRLQELVDCSENLMVIYDLLSAL